MELIHRTGVISEFKAAIYFVQRGYDVFFPIANNTAADFVAVNGQETIRVQVKSAHVTTKKSGSAYLATSFKRYPKIEDFDVLVVVYKNDLWVFPVDDVKHLRTVTLEKYQQINRSPENNFKAEPYKIGELSY